MIICELAYGEPTEIPLVLGVDVVAGQLTEPNSGIVGIARKDAKAGTPVTLAITGGVWRATKTGAFEGPGVRIGTTAGRLALGEYDPVGFHNIHVGKALDDDASGLFLFEPEGTQGPF